MAQPPTLAIGIDPDPQLDAPPSPSHRIFRQTSDAFFADHDLAQALGGRPVELALIDGMHQFEFVLRDFLNLERHCAPDATILVHDCFPLDEISAARERTTAFWSGDVWRALLALKKWRPDLALHTVGAPPTGLGVIRRLDPASRVLAENLDRICAEFRAVGYETIAGRKSEALNLVPNEWRDVQALLDAPVRAGRLTRSERPGIRAAVDQEVLPGDVARLRAAEVGAGVAELLRVAEAPGGDRLARVSASAPLDRHAPRLGAELDSVERSRSVAKKPGSRLLIVTLCRTVWRASPATKPVRPVRAPLESPSTGIGAFTAPEVMLTMRPNLRAIMPSTSP